MDVLPNEIDHILTSPRPDTTQHMQSTSWPSVTSTDDLEPATLSPDLRLGTVMLAIVLVITLLVAVVGKDDNFLFLNCEVLILRYYDLNIND